jgi:hypothetical protein
MTTAAGFISNISIARTDEVLWRWRVGYLAEAQWHRGEEQDQKAKFGAADWAELAHRCVVCGAA